MTPALIAPEGGRLGNWIVLCSTAVCLFRGADGIAGRGCLGLPNCCNSTLQLNNKHTIQNRASLLGPFYKQVPVQRRLFPLHSMAVPSTGTTGSGSRPWTHLEDRISVLHSLMPSSQWAASLTTRAGQGDADKLLGSASRKAP